VKRRFSRFGAKSIGKNNEVIDLSCFSDGQKPAEEKNRSRFGRLATNG